MQEIFIIDEHLGANSLPVLASPYVNIRRIFHLVIASMKDAFDDDKKELEIIENISISTLNNICQLLEQIYKVWVSDGFVIEDGGPNIIREIDSLFDEIILLITEDIIYRYVADKKKYGDVLIHWDKIEIARTVHEYVKNKFEDDKELQTLINIKEKKKMIMEWARN